MVLLSFLLRKQLVSARNSLYYAVQHMNLPHFKDITSIENKNVKAKQFHIAGKQLDKYEDFQSCQTVLKMSTLPSLSRYLTFPNTGIE